MIIMISRTRKNRDDLFRDDHSHSDHSSRQRTWTAELLEFASRALHLNPETFDWPGSSLSHRERALDSGMQLLSPISSSSIFMIAPDWPRLILFPFPVLRTRWMPVRPVIQNTDMARHEHN